MTSHRLRRGTELSLLIPVLLIALFGLVLVYLGKAATVPLPENAVNINAASAQQLAAALQIDDRLGRAIVADRTARGAFESVHGLRRDRNLKNVPTAPIDQRFIVRTPDQVARMFWIGVAGYLAGFLLVHVILRKAAPEGDPFLLPLVALLSGIGLMMLYTVQDPLRDTFVFGRQVWGMARFGLLALLAPQLRVFRQLPLRRYQYAYAVTAVALLILLRLFGHGPGDIPITIFGVEPVEVIKILLVFFIAAYITDRQGTIADRLRSVPRTREIAPLLIIYATTLLLFQVLKDLGPAVLLFGTLVLVLYLVTGRGLYPAAGAALLLIAGVVGYRLHLGFFVTRVTMWQNPWSNHDPRGIQLGQALWGFATGGLTGSGLGLGQPGFMSRAGSDLIFATIGEELGFVGAVLVLVVYCLVIARGFRIARNASTAFDRWLASGLTVLFGLQTMIIVGGVTGLIPLTGITLPFVSFGSSSLVANFFAIGLLLQISGKRIPSEMADTAPPEFLKAARVCALSFGVYLLGLVCFGPLLRVQVLQERETATRPISVPMADGVTRPQMNPRLTAFARTIPRGEIKDRNGRVLAQDAGANGGVPYLTPDGRRRVYSGGAAFGSLLSSVESPGGPRNALGMNAILQGYRTAGDLLDAYHSRYDIGYRPPRGTDVTLTIDSRLQQTAYDAIVRQAARLEDLRTHQPKNRGAAAVIDVATGQVLAAASSPGFDPETLTDEEWASLQSDADGSGALRNRALKGLYPPGSTFKIVTAGTALQDGRANTIIDCRHQDFNVTWRFDGKTYARRRITDEDGMPPHGQTDMAKALRVSCNVYFANLGIALGAPALETEARDGFQIHPFPALATLGAELPDCSYGQGPVQVTPVDMARVVQAVANNGTMQPLVFSRGSSKVTFGTVSHPLTPQNAAALQRMLLGVTTAGTAAGVFDGLPVAVAGKTGSAQNNQGDGMTHSWFAGFAPAVNPTIAFACVIENGGQGRQSAAPVCRSIVRAAL